MVYKRDLNKRIRGRWLVAFHQFKILNKVVTVKDLSIKTWCRIYVRLPRWRTSLFTDTEKSQVAPDSQLSDPSFATLRPGQRARDITRVCVRQKFVFCQELLCLALTISKRPSGSQGGNKPLFVGFLIAGELCCETSEGLRPVRGATSHHNQPGLSSHPPPAAGYRALERRGTFSTGRWLTMPPEMLPHVATGKTRLLLYHWNHQGSD